MRVRYEKDREREREREREKKERERVKKRESKKERECVRMKLFPAINFEQHLDSSESWFENQSVPPIDRRNDGMDF